MALEIAARWPHRIRSLALLCTALAGHEPSPELRTFGEREDTLIEAGDITGAADLNADTWLGPHADETTRDNVRQMQKHAFEVQLAAVEEFEPIKATFDLSAITAPTLLISGEHDFTDFSQIAASLSGQLADARHLELAWAGHLPSLERPEALNPLLIGFLQETLNPSSLERQE